MSTLARPRRLTLGLVTACILLASGCATRQEPSQAAMPPRPQSAPNKAPVAPGVIVIVTDQTGTLLGVVSLQNPVADPIMIKKSDLIAPQNIEEVLPEKVFLKPGVQTITIFAMGDPCQYVIQGGQAVKKCW